MTVTIQAKHITQGERHHNLRNPISLALQEVDTYAVVTATKIHIVGRVVDLPYHAQEWLHRFNRGWSVDPLTVTL